MVSSIENGAQQRSEAAATLQQFLLARQTRTVCLANLQASETEKGGAHASSQLSSSPSFLKEAPPNQSSSRTANEPVFSVIGLTSHSARMVLSDSSLHYRLVKPWEDNSAACCRSAPLILL